MKIFKKSLIILCCLSGFSATGLPMQSSEGVFMKEIPLNTTHKSNKENRGKFFVQVDDEDYEYLMVCIPSRQLLK